MTPISRCGCEHSNHLTNALIRIAYMDPTSMVAVVARQALVDIEPVPDAQPHPHTGSHARIGREMTEFIP